MADATETIESLRGAVLAFVEERDWAHFHTAKELSVAIAIEAAELQELFLWRTSAEVDEQIPQMRNRIAEELADIVILCLSLTSATGISLSDAVRAKIASNALKYPADLVRGRADKYTSYVSEDQRG